MYTATHNYELTPN